MPLLNPMVLDDVGRFRMQGLGLEKRPGDATDDEWRAVVGRTLPIWYGTR